MVIRQGSIVNEAGCLDIWFGRVLDMHMISLLIRCRFFGNLASFLSTGLSYGCWHMVKMFTRDIQSYTIEKTCVHCKNVDETMNHQFFEYHVAASI